MSELEFEVDINEADIGKVSLNQRTEIVFDALPSQTFTGRVRYISPSAQQTGAIRSYTVRIKLDSQEGLREGMGGHISLLSAP
jgi:multidrug efflux pump subunit AcrA (membrane-fusion protein)